MEEGKGARRRCVLLLWKRWGWTLGYISGATAERRAARGRRPTDAKNPPRSKWTIGRRVRKPTPQSCEVWALIGPGQKAVGGAWNGAVGRGDGRGYATVTQDVKGTAHPQSKSILTSEETCSEALKRSKKHQGMRSGFYPHSSLALG